MGRDQDIFNVWRFWQNVNTESGTTLDVNGTIDLTNATITATGLITTTHIADTTRSLNLPIGSFFVESVPVAVATTPGLEENDNVVGLVWADAEATPAAINFRVPEDYASGGAFEVVATQSGTTTFNQVDFQVYTANTGAAYGATVTDQTPVALTLLEGTPSTVTLTVATDFASLAAGTLVALEIWRDDTADGTDALEVQAVTFYYTASS
jgi:hypothetical protein